MSYNSRRLPTASIGYPHHPGSRTGSPETSEEAANAVAPFAGSCRDRIFDHLLSIYPKGHCSEQIAEAVGISRYAVRPRVSELRRDARIECTGDRRTNNNGRSVALWKAVPNE